MRALVPEEKLFSSLLFSSLLFSSLLLSIPFMGQVLVTGPNIANCHGPRLVVRRVSGWPVTVSMTIAALRLSVPVASCILNLQAQYFELAQYFKSTRISNWSEFRIGCISSLPNPSPATTVNVDASNPASSKEFAVPKS